MAMQYEAKFNLRSNDFDCYGKLLPSAILDMFQEVAGNHAEKLGIGFEELKAKNLLWVIVRSKFEVVKHPCQHSEVTVKTWPLPANKISFRRDYLMTDEKGEVLIRGTSDWFIINSQTRSFEKAERVYPSDEFVTDYAISEKPKKLHSYKGETDEYSVVPAFCDIDRNGHVNNTKYANFILNALDLGNKDIASFQIDYHKEVLKGEQLIISTAIEDDTAFASGKNKDGDAMFICEIKIK